MKEDIEQYIFGEFSKKKEVEPAVFFMVNGRPVKVGVKQYMDKAESARMVHRVIKDFIPIASQGNSVTHAAFVSESYMKVFSGDNAEGNAQAMKAEYKEIRLMPSRIETVMLLFWTPDTVEMIHWEITKTGLKKLDLPPVGKADKQNGIVQNPFK